MISQAEALGDDATLVFSAAAHAASSSQARIRLKGFGAFAAIKTEPGTRPRSSRLRHTPGPAKRSTYTSSDQLELPAMASVVMSMYAFQNHSLSTVQEPTGRVGSPSSACTERQSSGHRSRFFGML